MGHQPRRWTPLYVGEEADRLWVVLRSIASDLVDNPVHRLSGRTLVNGSAGIAIFFAYLYQAQSGVSLAATQAEDWLAHATQNAAARRWNGAFLTGMPGIEWSRNHLRDRLAGDVDMALNIDVGARVLEQIQGTPHPWPDHFDLMFGLCGQGTYGLATQTAAGTAIAEAAVERLHETAQQTVDGITWLTRPELLPDWQRKRSPSGYFNLGLAHGVPGVVAFLSRAVAKGIAVTTTRTLLRGAVTWILAHRNADPRISVFPNVIPNNRAEDSDANARLAWCYGDLGISTALYWTARTVENLEWEQEALAIARHASVRTPDQSGVKDAMFCHGAAGNGHMFNRLYQATGDPLFGAAARTWFDQVVNFHRPGFGIGGFQSWEGPGVPLGPWLDAPGLLQGSAGVGLALLAAITEIEPEWDRVLLISSSAD